MGKVVVNLGEGKVFTAPDAVGAVQALQELRFDGSPQTLDEFMKWAAQNIFRLAGKSVRPAEGTTLEERCRNFLLDCQAAGILEVTFEK